MGLLDKLGDMAIGGLTKKETIRLPYEEVAKLVTDKFIKGADDDRLKKVMKTAVLLYWQNMYY